MNVLTLVFLSIGFAILLHRKRRDLLFPSIVAGLLAALSFHLIGFFIEGAFDSLIIVSILTTSTFALLIALVIGLMMRSSGKKLTK